MSWLNQLCIPWYQRLSQIREVCIGQLNTVSLQNLVITCGRVVICGGTVSDHLVRASPAAVMLGTGSKAATNNWKGKRVAHGLVGCLTAQGTLLYLEKALIRKPLAVYTYEQ